MNLNPMDSNSTNSDATDSNVQNEELSDLKLRFPLGSYLRQLFFSPLASILWSPKQFWSIHNTQLLENSFMLDYIQHTRYRDFLEYCLKLSLISDRDFFPDQGDDRDPKRFKR